MTRLLVLGMCPLPFENTTKNFGPGIRTWQFIKPLLNTHHEIVAICRRIPFIYPADTRPEIKEILNGITVYNLDDETFLQSRRIQEIHDSFKPDAILTATLFSTPPLGNLKTECPIWIDLFGHVMAEAQAKAYRYNDNSFLDHFLSHELGALKFGDIYSTVSEAQEHATIGELGLLKRLTAETTGYPFTRTIPCAMDPELYTHDKTVCRGLLVPEDAFVVLWSGGYNTWTDIETLFKGIEFAMQTNPKIWFVSTGGQIDGHDEITYPAFQKLVEQSKHKDRYLLKGWVPKEDVHNYYFEANIGVNIDRFMYEGYFGSKNRVLDWMRAALPSLIGQLCELSYELPSKNLAYSYPLGNHEALGKKLVELSEIPDQVKSTGQRAQKYGLENLSFNSTTLCFQEWLVKPEKSPDHCSGSSQDSLNTISVDVARFTQSLEKQIVQKDAHIQDLEKYIHHLESHIRNQPESNDVSDMFAERPATSARALHISDTPEISVIVVTWNGKKYIDECLESVLNSHYSHTQLIVIDNGSTDGTWEHITRKYSNTATLINNPENMGFTRGVNQGIELARGEICYLLNQDAILHPENLQHVINCLKDESIAIAGCKILHPGGNILQHAGGILHDNGLTDHYGAGESDTGQYDEDRDMAYVTGAAFAFKKTLIDEIGVFDLRYSPAYFEELDFCIRASRAGYRIRYCHKAIAWHHESTSTGKFSQRFYYLYHRNRLRLITKHYSAGYLLREFRRFESDWFKKHAPKEQVLPLLKAYTVNIHRLIWVFFRTLKNKVIK